MELRTAQIATRKSGALAWLIFNNPAKHNAISMEMAEAVPRVMSDFDADPAIRVVIVSGAGERAFAAGSDISSFGAVRSDPAQNRHYNEVNERSYNAVYECSKPTIAMIRGYCIGGGLDFAASCDIRICSDDATFAIPAVRLGLGYGYEGQIRMNRIIGPTHARDLFFTGRRYKADEALNIGLVHEVVPAAHLEPRVSEYAEAIAQNAPLTLKALKRGFLELEKDPAARNMQAAQDLIDACFASADYLEGREAFAQKRPARFQGR
ncbi:MAG: enoyl-CoA hydratase [Burkholderiales bacterium]